MKFAMGAKSRERYPTTTMGVAANLRQYLIRTHEYTATLRKWEEDGRKGRPPARDLGYEAMSEVLDEADLRPGPRALGHRRDDAGASQAGVRLRPHAASLDRGVQGGARAGPERHLARWCCRWARGSGSLMTPWRGPTSSGRRGSRWRCIPTLPSSARSGSGSAPPWRCATGFPRRRPSRMITR